MLYGSLGLSYERHWYEGDIARATTSEFIQNYNLGLRGFVIDPRLVNFDVSGLLTRSSRKNLGESYTLIGTNLNIMLLETLPPKWLKSWKYIPNPITLRFSDYSNTYDSMNYGISLRYAMPEQIRLLKKKKTNGNGNGVLFPVTYFDYDHYDYKSGGYKTSVDLYSLRSELTGRHYIYRLNYEGLAQRGSIKEKRNTFELGPNYKFYNEETKRLLEIANLLRFEEINKTKTLSLQNNTNWSKPVGKDTLTLTGNAQYSITSQPESKSTTSYNIVFSGLYRKIISPRLVHTPSLSLGLGKTGTRDTYFGRLTDIVEADISRLFRGSGGILLGDNYNGPEYGFNVNLYTKTRILVSAGYSYSLLSLDEGKTSTSMFGLGASGPIFRYLTFNANAQYTLKDVSNTNNPYSEDSLLYNANISWRFARTSVSLGGSYSETTKRNGETTKTKYTSLYGNISRLLTRRMFLNVYSTWTKDQNNLATLEIKPRLEWRKGLTLLSVEYDYRRLSRPEEPSSTEHRFFIRAERRFFRII